MPVQVVARPVPLSCAAVYLLMCSLQQACLKSNICWKTFLAMQPQYCKADALNGCVMMQGHYSKCGSADLLLSAAYDHERSHCDQELCIPVLAFVHDECTEW